MTVSTAFEIPAPGGASLAASLFEGSGDGPAVLLSSAAAVERRFYAPFAERLVAGGASAVLTYDYRGVGGSTTPTDTLPRMKEWGTLDFPAALAALESHAPGRAIVGIGHSFGGLAIGLSDVAPRFERYAMVASLNGYYGRTAEPISVFARMNLLGVPITYLLGRMPGRLGLGTTLPGQVFRDWARWCRSPDFFFKDPMVPEARHFRDVRIPLLSVSVGDDRWGTPRAVGALLRHFPAADLHEMTIAPDPAAPIGHLGLFRRAHADRWPDLIAYLVRGELPAGASVFTRRRAA